MDKFCSLLLGLFFIVISCTSDNDQPAVNNDPPRLIAYFTNHHKYYFNTENRLYRLSYRSGNPSLVYHQNFTYDNQGRLVQIITTDNNGNPSQPPINISYDANGHINNYNGTLIYYNNDNDFYYSNYTSNIESDYIDPSTGHHFQETLITFDKYYSNQESGELALNYCLWEKYRLVNLTTGDVISDGGDGQYFDDISCHFVYHNGDNLYSEGSSYHTDYTFHDSPNPLYNTNSNINFLHTFIAPSHTAEGHPLNLLMNKHNMETIEGDSDGPDLIFYDYDYNESGQPTNVTFRRYYAGVLEDEGHYSNYYYEGDDIPID